MLPVQLRILLFVGAVFAFWVVCRKVRKQKVLVEDAIFWVVLSAVFVLLALFPQIAICISHVVGFMSASNFVYLVVVVLLLWKTFTNSAEISRLKNKVDQLAQEIALAQTRGHNCKQESDVDESTR